MAKKLLCSKSLSSNLFFDHLRIWSWLDSSTTANKCPGLFGITINILQYPSKFKNNNNINEKQLFSASHMH